MSRALSPSHEAEDDLLPELEGATPLALTRRFSLLVSEHMDFVARSVRRLGVPATDVEDAVQKVFLVANRRLDAIEPGSERSFLFGVASRVASHERRAQQRRERVHSAAHQIAPDRPATPEGMAATAELRTLLDRLLDGLPEELRAVFVLFELEEMSLTDIAGLLGIPRGTVASRLRRARELFSEASVRARAPGHEREGTT